MDSAKEIHKGILKLLIEHWRDDFKDFNLPFSIVQIHDLAEKITSDECGWRNIQFAQEEVCQTVNNTFLVEIKDICETITIHPKSKQKLALRIVEVIKEL